MSQYDERVEVLISDNASPDNTEEIVSGFKKQFPQINYIRNEENIGPDANFLQCYKRARGKFVLLLGDDDLIVENSLRSLLAFLEGAGKECSLVFLNHVLFEREFVSLEHCSNPFLEKTDSYITSDKIKFMEAAKHQLTYMSAFLLQRDAFESVSEPEKYSDTSFMHTCIVFEATKDENSVFGIFGQPFVAQDATVENTVFWKRPQEILLVFGTREERVYCEIAPQFGYDKEQMERIYTDFLCKSWRGSIIRIKAFAAEYWKEYYHLYAEPVLQKHKRAYRKLRLYIRCPVWAAKLAYKFVRPLYRKMKRKKGEI